MRKHLLALLFVLLCFQPVSGQEKGEEAQRKLSVCMTILDQPDSPLEIIEMGVQMPKPGVGYICFAIKNRSEKPIIGLNVGVFYEGRPVTGLITGWVDDNERPDVIQTVLEVGEEYHSRFAPHVLERLRDELKNVVSQPSFSVDLAVVKVRFADGTKYDATERLRSLGWHLPGQREPKN